MNEKGSTIKKKNVAKKSLGKLAKLFFVLVQKDVSRAGVTSV